MQGFYMCSEGVNLRVGFKRGRGCERVVECYLREGIIGGEGGKSGGFKCWSELDQEE